MNANRSDISAVADEGDYFFEACFAAGFNKALEKKPADALS
jgi:hypothetical protein